MDVMLNNISYDDGLDSELTNKPKSSQNEAKSTYHSRLIILFNIRSIRIYLGYSCFSFAFREIEQNY